MLEPAATDGALARALGRRDLVLFAINCVIGSGVFGLPAVLYARVGAWSIAGMLLAAAVVALITLCFAEVGSAFRDTGGPYLYAHHTFGAVAGFEVGWLMWVARLAGFAAVTNLFCDYAGYFVPALTGGSARAALVVLLVLTLTGINLVGVRRAAAVNNALTLAKLVPLVLFVAVGVFFVDGARLALPAPVPVAALPGAVMLAIYAFSGFEAMAVPGGEIRDPARAIPFALLTALAVVTALYVGVQVVAVGTLPALATSARPLADAARHVLGLPAATVMALGALASTLGVAHAILLSAARLPFAMAERGQLPAPLAAVHPRFRTPWVSLLVSSAGILALTLATSFVTAATFAVGVRVTIYLCTCAALPVLRRRAGGPRTSFRVPAGDAVAAASVALCLGLLASRPGSELRQLGVAAGLGLALYLASAPWRRPLPTLPVRRDVSEI